MDNVQTNYTDDSKYKIIYVCAKTQNIKKMLKIFKKKYPENVYCSRLLAEEYYTIKPLEIKKDQTYRDKDGWIEWLIQHADEVWLTSKDDYKKEIQIAKKYNIPIKYM